MKLKRFNEFKINEDFNTTLDISVEISDVKQEINDLKRRRTELDMDMENEAGQKGDEWTDDDANRYGEQFNELDDQEVELRKKLENLVKSLDEEEEKALIRDVADTFKETLEEVTHIDKFEYKITGDGLLFTIHIGEEEMHFGAYSTGAVYLEELGKKFWLGDVDGKSTKKFLKKIFSLEGDEYKEFLDSFDESDFE